MGVTVDVAYKSLNKFNEVLCGDKVELLQTEDSNITAWEAVSRPIFWRL